MNWLRKHKNVILITVIAGFIISTFVGFGLYLRSGAANLDTVAEVNEEKVPYRRFTALYNQVVNHRRDKGETLAAEALQQIKQEVLQNLIQESVFFQEARRYGFTVSDAELAQALMSIPAFQKEGKFNVQSYAQALQFGLRTSPEEFEESQRRQIAIMRLRAFISQGVRMTDRELEYEYAVRKLQNPAKKSLSPEEELKAKDELRRKLQEEQGAHILNRWYQQLGTSVKVKVHLEEIERRGGR